jgi:hypothetical protein
VTDFKHEIHTIEVEKDFFVLRMTEKEAELLLAIVHTIAGGTSRQISGPGLKVLLHSEVITFATEIEKLAKDVVKAWSPDNTLTIPEVAQEPEPTPGILKKARNPFT